MTPPDESYILTYSIVSQDTNDTIVFKQPAGLNSIRILCLSGKVFFYAPLCGSVSVNENVNLDVARYRIKILLFCIG